MITIQGKYNTALVYTDALEPSAEGQIRALTDQPFAQGSKIRVMPDVHAGAGCTIGTTMTIADAIVPNLVGVDIGCGMETVLLKQTRLDLPKLDALIRQRIPSGMSVRDEPHAFAGDIDLTALRCEKSVDTERGSRSIGTLGGGNHFIEIDKDEDGRLYLVIHSGSRHLGLQVAQYYQRAAWDELNHRGKAQLNALIAEYKAQGREKDIQRDIDRLKKTDRMDVPFALAYARGALLDDYLHDMRLMQRFASLNRRAMAREILRGMRLDAEDAFTTIHNYIDTDSMILRKGAVSAMAGERLLIPINMRDGSLVCVGKGNPDWNMSAPHGAGRLMSRTEAKHSFTVSQFKKEMKGVFSTTVGAETLDECPMAYKDMSDIARNIGPTAAIEKIIRPVYNFKAGMED